MIRLIDIALAKKMFAYDKESGDLYYSAWRNGCKLDIVGKNAGFLHKGNNGKPYKRVRFNGHNIYVHRIIWAIVTGEQPKEIDHIDGDSLNNKWANLREVSHTENARNQKMHSTNTSGIMGVTYRKDSGRWRARIKVDGKMISLGTYASKSDAAKARLKAEEEYGYHDLHGATLS